MKLLTLTLVVGLLSATQAAFICHTRIARDMSVGIDHDFVRVSDSVHTQRSAYSFGGYREAPRGGTFDAVVRGGTGNDRSCCSRFTHLSVHDNCARDAAHSLMASPYDDMNYPASLNIVGALFSTAFSKKRGDTAVCWDFARDWATLISVGNPNDISNGVQSRKPCLAIRRRSHYDHKTQKLTGACAKADGWFSLARCRDCEKEKGCQFDDYTGLMYDPDCKVVDETPDKGMTCLEVQNAPKEWTCESYLWDQIEQPVCNCGCGSRDPDCDKPNHASDCDQGRACGPTNVCVRLLDQKTAIDCELGKGCLSAAREAQQQTCTETWKHDPTKDVPSENTGFWASSLASASSVSESISASSSTGEKLEVSVGDSAEEASGEPKKKPKKKRANLRQQMDIFRPERDLDSVEEY